MHAHYFTTCGTISWYQLPLTQSSPQVANWKYSTCWIVWYARMKYKMVFTRRSKISMKPETRHRTPATPCTALLPHTDLTECKHASYTSLICCNSKPNITTWKWNCLVHVHNQPIDIDGNFGNTVTCWYVLTHAQYYHNGSIVVTCAIFEQVYYVIFRSHLPAGALSAVETVIGIARVL